VYNNTVPTIRKRPRRDDGGQALAEYGILLALMAGVSRLQRLTDGILSQPPAMLLAGIAVVVVVFAFASSRGRR
jgi:hypothetical protein